MKLIKFYILLTGIISLSSCKKYLDQLPNPQLAIPNSVKDLQALLDNYNTMNYRFPTTMVMLSDDYYLLPNDLNSVANSTYRNQYTWQKDDSQFSDWVSIYGGPIKTANVILDNIENISRNQPNTEEINKIKGSALFFRSFYFYALAQLFAQPYQKSTANSDLGIALRLDADFNKVSTRSTVSQTYEQIIQDLESAIEILPEKHLLKSRPTKAAAYGTLARTYLAMNDYQNAGNFADLCIKSYGQDSLINYNTLNTNSEAPFKRFNKEIIFDAIGAFNPLIQNSRAKIDSNLYLSYSINDLRKTLFFKTNGDNTYNFKGDYDGNGVNTGFAYGGIVLDEIYLIRAEAYARANQVELALKDLNRLLLNRFKSGSFIPSTATDSKTALILILAERRKELIFRGTRWTDLRRLKEDPDHLVIPSRRLGDQVYTLNPSNTGYTLLIPIHEINISGMQQNPR